jgi:hypothetical protein
MKKILFAVVFLVGMINAALAFKGAEVSQEAKSAFAKKFPTAKFAKWNESEASGIYIVRFLYNDEGIISYVTEDGAILAVARRVGKEKLPVTVANLIETKYSTDRIISMDELTTDADISYLVTVEDGKKRSLIRIYANGNIYVVKKEKLH